MTPDRWRQIESLFVRVAECAPPEREILLDRICQGDQELRREVESLLACDAPEKPLLEIPAGAESEPDMAGRRIGAYRLIRMIGHGGMGAVYLGVRDDDQYQKQVAIKLLKRGMDTDFMLSRFRQERQILANLEHPFIARLIDGGATEDGLPYFVMEHVDGVPITKYCADKNLTIPERLRLFRLVCEAVQYAHQNLVVHRDIKPSNILTTKEGIPKLLDFGIAKVLDAGGQAGATLTEGEFRALTPDYASPEQVKGLRMSTASDTYSLGAVLYELLTGQGPHRFPSGSLGDMEKTICEIEPEKPSNAAIARAENAPAVRNQLRRQLAGDLDHIVLTALRKDPQRRYASAAEFSEDLRRHLEALPIIAQGDAWTYRAGKFVQRNRLAVGAALLVVASLIGGIVTTTIQARRAERRFQIARKLANAVMLEVRGSLARLPGSTAARASIIELVVQYLDGLAQDSGRDPAFDLEIASAYEQVAGVEAHPYQPNLGHTAAALQHYQRAIEIYGRWANRTEIKAQALGGLISTSIEAADVEARNGNPAAARARLQTLEALAAKNDFRDPAVLSPGPAIYLYDRLGDVAMEAGLTQQALSNYRQALEISVRRDGYGGSVDQHNSLRGEYSKVAGAQLIAGDLSGARENYEAALRVVEEVVRQPDSTVYQRSMLSAAHQNLGDVLGNPEDLNFGDRAGALAHYRAAAAIDTELAAADRQDLRARDNLADTCRGYASILLEENPREALRLYQQAASISRELSAAESSNTKYRRDVALGETGAGESLNKLGRYQDALQLLAPALETMKTLAAADPEQTPLTASAGLIHRDIGTALLAIGDEKGALDHCQLALAATEEITRRAPGNLYYQRQHADSLEALGRYYLASARRHPEFKPQAEQWLQKSLEMWQDWMRRNVAAPYASVRERQAAALLTTVKGL